MSNKKSRHSVAVFFAAASIGSLSIFGSISYAATQEDACEMWSYMGQTLAIGRDNGVTLAAQQKKINGLKPTSGGLTAANIAMATNIAYLVYKDFPRKSPGDIEQIIYIGCNIKNK